MFDIDVLEALSFIVMFITFGFNKLVRYYIAHA